MTPDTELPETDTGPRTVPWQEGEYVTLNGWPLVYTVTATELLVRLPGGRCATVPELRAQHIVVMPRRVRV